MKTYYYCEHDKYGQRTGNVFAVNIKESEISKSVHGFPMYNGYFLYECPAEAQRAALN